MGESTIARVEGAKPCACCWYWDLVSELAGDRPEAAPVLPRCLSDHGAHLENSRVKSRALHPYWARNAGCGKTSPNLIRYHETESFSPRLLPSLE